MREIFKDIHDYESLYQVSNLGRVKSLERVTKHNQNGIKRVKECILKQSLSSGYPKVTLHKRGVRNSKRVHQLMAIAFLGHRPNGLRMVINHIDFNPLNNNLDNLEIVTNRENSNQKHLKSSSKYIGVRWNRGKWEAQIRIGKKSVYLGRYSNELDAAKAYKDVLKTLNE